MRFWIVGPIGPHPECVAAGKIQQKGGGVGVSEKHLKTNNA